MSKTQTYDDDMEVDDTISKEPGKDYASSVYSDTTSVNSSVFEYQYENGRRYHAFRQGKYILPNDDREQERLDILHHFWMLVKRGHLHLAPIPANKIKSILDLGTGTGIWAMEAGDCYPDAEVIGTDLSPIQPNWVPPNVKFQVDDVEEDWTFEKNKFDLINIRNLVGSVRDWKKLFTQIYDHIKPGGFIEFTDFDIRSQYSDDGTLREDGPTRAYYRQLWVAMEKSGTATRTDIFEGLLKEVGFEDVTVVTQKIPVKPWTKNARLKELGNCLLELSAGYESYGLAAFTRILGMEEKKARELIRGAEREHMDLSIHAYLRIYIMHGRKPLHGRSPGRY